MVQFLGAWNTRNSFFFSGLLDDQFILEFAEQDSIPPNFWTHDQTETNISTFFSNVDSTKLSFKYEVIGKLEVAVHVDSIVVWTSSRRIWSSSEDWILFLSQGSGAEGQRGLYLSYWSAPMSLHDLLRMKSG